MFVSAAMAVYFGLEVNAPEPKMAAQASRPPRSRAVLRTVVAPEKAVIMAKKAAPL